jgi:aminoglycoside phosphotransferase (APT) family kinase protein
MNDSIRQSAVRLTAKLFPNRSIDAVEILNGGLINTNVKISFSNRKPVVVRTYRDGFEACKKELAVHDLIQASVPVAKIIHSEPDGLEDHPAFSILEFVEGLTFQQLKGTNPLRSIKEAAYSVGKTLADVGRFAFPRPGVLTTNDEILTVGSQFMEGPNQIPRLLDGFLSSAICQQRAGSELTDQIHAFGWAHANEIPDLNSKPCLVHCDFGDRNILVSEQDCKWNVAAILDWELAISGSPLLDVGHFLRYESHDHPLREPYFSRAFTENGGELPDNWRKIVRMIDLTGIVESLTHDNLPDDITSELVDLVKTTISSRANT